MKKILSDIDYSSTNTQHRINDIINMLMCNTKDYDKKFYEYIKCEIYEVVNGKRITDDLADEWVNSMIPKAKWTKEQVLHVAKLHGVDIPINCAYVLFNMFYSDSKNVYGEGEDEESISMYIKGVKDWYYDEDIKNGEEKLYNYYKYIFKGN